MLEYDNLTRQLEFANHLNEKRKMQPCKYCDQNKEGWCLSDKSWCSTAKTRCEVINSMHK